MRIDETYLPPKILFCLAFFVAALVSSGCNNAGNMEEVEATSDVDVTATAPPQPEPAPEPAEPEPVEQRQQETVDGSYLEGTHWAPGHEGVLIEGLNGGEYPPYEVGMIKEFQRFLFEEKLYDGPVSGVLDERTMEAIAEFQRANGIVASGIPSPETREAAQEAFQQSD